MKIIIRTDSSIYIGTGHVMRCLVLAKELNKYGHNIEFVTRRQNGDSIEYINKQGFDVIELPEPKVEIIPSSSSDYLGWLQVSLDEDADQFIHAVKNVDIVIVDHYGLSNLWESRVRKELNCKIVAIDDLVRKHDADIIIDQTSMRKSIEYEIFNNAKNILTGSEYALLNPRFIAERQEALNNNALPEKLSILLSMGGIDKDNITFKVLESLKILSEQGVLVTVLLGKKSPNYKQVKNFCMVNNKWTKHIDFTKDMAKTMAHNTLAIGAPGTTSWERACLGIPSIIIPIAENQASVAKNLVIAGASILVKKDDIDKSLIKSIDKLIKNWHEYRESNFNLCDGLGVRRIASFIDKMNLKNDNRFYLRLADHEDINQVYEWQLHDDTRRYALDKNKPSWEDHNNWMQLKISSKKDFFYMIMSFESKDPVGVVRLDEIINSEYLISIFVSPLLYGKGIAKEALNLIDVIHKEATIHATVLKDNIVSQKLFLSANYNRVSKEAFIRLPIK